MNSFTIILSLILFGLSALCYFLPYKSGQKATGLTVSLIFAFITSLTFVGNLDFLIIFIWPIVFASQIVFIIYWTFRLRGKKKMGTISAIILTVAFLLITMYPWISDWTFSKKDARQILLYHSIELKEDFKILENGSGGLRDYYHSFTLKISNSDYDRIAKRLKTSKNYIGLFTDLTKIPTSNYKTYDTLDFETNYQFEREYFSRQEMEDGTYHFIFQLSKTQKELTYIGSNE